MPRFSLFDVIYHYYYYYYYLINGKIEQNIQGTTSCEQYFK